MTTGVPIYLVSACASAEEFVAAFRRYADRTGLFIPIAEPFPAGRRGRVALTLKDGGVMVDGEAEVIQSSAKPSSLYGRIGMTIKFVEADEPSKTVLGELEKARLAMKPARSSVSPRPAPVPAEPRPVPPTPGGRIDAANALAECVAIGDVGALVAGEPPKASQKFVIPSIPSVGDRPRTPSTPPPPRSTSLGMPAVEPAAKPETKPEAKPLQPTSYGGVPKADPVPAAAKQPRVTQLFRVMAPPPKPTDSAIAVAAPPRFDPARPTLPADLPTAKTPPREDPTTPLMMKSIAAPATAAPRRPPAPSPRSQTPVAPLPVVRPPAKPAPTLPIAEVEGERTDLTAVPQAPTTNTTAVPFDAPTVDSGRAFVADTAVPQVDTFPAGARPSRSGGMRASEIMAAVPSEDWTMAPDASGPTVVPTIAQPQPGAEATQLPKGPPTGDWTIAADPEAPDGWAKPMKAPVATPLPATGNPDRAVASAKAFVATEWEDKPTGIGMPLVEIDPTLMEPLQPMLVEPVLAPPPGTAVTATGLPILPLHFAPATNVAPVAAPPPMSPSMAEVRAQPASFGLALGFDVTDGGAGLFVESQRLRYPVAETATTEKSRRKRTLIVAVSVSLIAIAVLVLAIMFVTGRKHRGTLDGTKSDSLVAIGSGSSVPAVAIPDASARATWVAPPAPTAPEVPVIADAGVAETGSAAAATCAVEVTTQPPGAEVAIGKTTVLGTTPGTFNLPCGVDTKLYIRKAKYIGTIKNVTATAETPPVAIRLVAAVFAVKVTSTPAGATITVGGKSLGVTPTSIKLPAFATSTITLVKDGFMPDTQKLGVKQNNLSHHVILKKLTKHRAN